VFPICGRSRIVDFVTWHRNPKYFFIFLAQKLMYTGYNGATYVYVGFLTMARIYIQNFNFWLWNDKNGEFESAEGKGRPSKKDAWSVENFAITKSHGMNSN
jgi:hypothetical protein